MKKDDEWWLKKPIRFECQGSGKCCTSHGEYGYVYMTKVDRQRMAKDLKMSTSAFTKKHCDKTSGVWHLKEDPKNPDCRFLTGKSCSVYNGRPTQCRTWPFWPEVMNPKSWAKDVAAFCPGIGKGPIVPVHEIERQLLEQKNCEDQIVSGK